MSAKVIISYDGTSNDDDALALGKMLARAGFALALAYVRHSQARLPRSWAGREMCLAPSEMIEVKGFCTSAATATSGSPRLRASITSGSYETAKLTLPADSSLRGAEGSEGTATWTFSPARLKSPCASAR